MKVNMLTLGHPVTLAVVTVAVSVGLGVGIGGAAQGESAEGGTGQGRVPPAVASVAPRVTETARPTANATYDDGSRDAREAAGWAVINPGTPAARYWAQHGVGTEDSYRLCEVALRVQYVRGYNDPGADDSHQPLWHFECGGVSDSDRDSITIAAVEWGATHAEGDG